ncbi:MAG TPA: TIR domain-containing protein [Thermoanaerobaculia bacterium]|nr:TIR domain-containing protein [Thermoanaerobaculia bacterium]
MPSSKPNPFVYGAPVDISCFIGRQTEVDLLFQQVTSTSRGSVAIIGERRIGKTSLLHYVSAPDVIRRFNLEQESSIFLFIDCAAIAPLTITRFWQYILTRLQRQLKRVRAQSPLLGTIAALLDAPEIRTSEIEFLIEDLHAENLILVLLLDEFEWIVRTDFDSEAVTRELLGGLRALINHVSRALSLIVATRRPLHELCQDVRFMGSPFYNNFIYLHLRPFSRPEADSLLDQMLKDTDVVFTPADKTLVYELAGTHPLLLQAAAACVFDLRRAALGGEVDRRLVLERFMDLTEHQWQDLWRWSTSEEQDVLTRMGRDPHGAAALLQRRPNERRRLLERGLIVDDGGTARLFSPMLRHWLMERAVEQRRRQTSPGQTVAEAENRTMVFVSYSHKDEAEKEALLTQLRVLQRGADLIEVWSDDEIGGGEAWEAAIEKALLRARVAVLLISANFLTSEFILRTEVPNLLRRRQQDGITVIPIVAKGCAWRKIEWLKSMNVRPKNGDPVWGGADNRAADDVLAEIAEEIAGIVGR